MINKTAFVDVDGVCADLLSEWLRKYNIDYGDTLRPEGVHGWGLHEYVLPKCGMAIYDYLESPHVYDLVQPIQGAVDGVKALRENDWRVVFPTTTPRSTSFRKFDWLKEHGFEPNTKDYIEIDDKSLLSPLNSFLLDDSVSNVFKFRGEALLFSQNHNLSEKYPKRVHSWKRFIDFWITEMEFDILE